MVLAGTACGASVFQQESYMSDEKRVDRLEVNCDMPHPAVVGGCALGDFVRPADVAWHKAPVLGPNLCRCRRYCGDMQEYVFSFSDGHVETYRLLQCPHCLTIWWRRIRCTVPSRAA